MFPSCFLLSRSNLFFQYVVCLMYGPFRAPDDRKIKVGCAVVTNSPLWYFVSDVLER